MFIEFFLIDKVKFVVVKKVVEFVEDGMCVGFGIGLIVVWMVCCLGELVCDEGFKIKGVFILICIV